MINLKETPKIKGYLQNLKGLTTDFIEDKDAPPYTMQEVNDCMQLLNDCLENLETSGSKEEGMQIVKRTILALNELNNKCQRQLIETTEREYAAQIIILAGYLKGYNDINDDITYEWRNW